jgi:hypothetical protein
LSGVFDLSNQAEITTTTDDPTPSNNVSTVSNTIDAEPPTPPTLVSPADGSSINDSTPTLTWNPSPSSDVAGYLLDFDGAVPNDVGKITSFTTTILANGTYTWTLAACDALGNTSAYTDTWSFTVDTTAPAISAVAPADGATEVTIAASVVITFSEPIDAATFAYTVTPDPGGWSISWGSGGTVATLTHAPFAYQETYTVVVITANDLAGNLLAGTPYEWSFTTAANRVYLPVVFNDYVLAPDLVVEQIMATDYSIQLVVKNEGNVTVVESFWVDVYINPNPAPTHANQIWSDVASEGLVWGVTVDLEPGETLMLTIGDDYYKPQHSSDISWPLAVGTEVYAQVDSYNVGTTYGRVLENHEIRGEAYNNISHVTVQVLDLDEGSGRTEQPVTSGNPLIVPADLPPRSKKRPELE